MERKKRKIALGIGSAFLLVSIAFTLLPGGYQAVWKQVFAAAGLTDFSAQAEGWPAVLHVLEVGKADALVVECEGRFMVVDAGTPDRGEQVCRYLKQRGAESLDYVVNTHPDSDHIGGLAEVLREYPTENFLIPELPEGEMPGDFSYLDVMECVEEKGIPIHRPKSGETFFLGGMEVQVLCPDVPQQNSNDNSLVLRLIYGDTSFLLMGDAEEREEGLLLESGAELKADVLKVGHHGSKTSTTQELLKAVEPRWAAISVEWDRNGLPDREVLDRLSQSGTEIYRTDLQGTLLFLSDGEQIVIKTER